MTQTRYHTEHYDSQSGPQPSHSVPLAQGRPSHATRTSPRPGSPLTRLRDVESVAEPGPQAGDVSTLRFLASRKLRRLDVEGPSPLSLTLNGRPLGTLMPGENTFEPPIPLKPGDVLQLEVLADTAEECPMFSGWQSPTDGTLQAGDRQDGRRS